MAAPEPALRGISDTAHWVAVYRAKETERPDALFRDPYARRLAGERGDQLAGTTLATQEKNTWAFVVRTYLVDRMILRMVEEGTGAVLNLAAGLDARPYRLPLPPDLVWVEVDLPGIMDEKEAVLRDEQPVCRLERVRLDLSDTAARRGLFERVGRAATRTLVLTEGLLVYLTRKENAALARDLAAVPGFAHWILDIPSPGLLRMLQRQIGRHLGDAGAPLKFGPEEGPEFFVPHGWRPLEVRSMLREAARVKRVSWFLRLLALLPHSNGRQGSRPWSGVCLMERA